MRAQARRVEARSGEDVQLRKGCWRATAPPNFPRDCDMVSVTEALRVSSGASLAASPESETTAGRGAYRGPATVS